MQVRIVNVEVEWGGKPPKKWGKAIVSYDYNGNARKQNVMSFSNPEVFKKVQELVGQTVDVEVGKNDKDFTEWRSISVSGASVPSGTVPGSTTSATRVSGSNYETKEERAARQVLIVKQSSLSAAVATLTVNAGKDKLQVEDVMKLAQEYTDWVFSKENDESGFDTMDNDIPF